MSDLGELSARVTTFRQQEEQAAINRLAAKLARKVEECIQTQRRLDQLEFLPDEFDKALDGRRVRSRAAMQRLVERWRAFDGAPDHEGLASFQSDLLEVEVGARGELRDALKGVEAVFKQLAGDVNSNLDLASTLNIGDEQINQATATYIAQINLLKQAIETDNYAQLNAETFHDAALGYAHVAGTEALLKAASLPRSVAPVLRTLLQERSLALTEIDSETLMALFNTPAFAQVCHLTLTRPSGSQEARS